ncbi:MAG: type II toxin-antitoxin system RelE/ParE family toxin [Bacteroidia bacterium]|nr:type II toxin-antitoxin system RelE/ParE family toxin [Bacteroidia bacterium]
MNYRFISYNTFIRELKRLSKRYRSLKNDLAALEEELSKNPQLGTDLGNGFRKIRLAITSKGKGKRSGARVITLTLIVSTEEITVGFIYIYDKSESENITDKELKELLKQNGLL